MNLDKSIDWLLDAYRRNDSDTRIDQECQALIDTLRNPKRMQELANQAADDAVVPMTPREFGEFDLIGVVGAGGMGQVFRAVQRRLGRVQALKILPADRVSDAQAMSRFQREIRAIGQLNHPSIVTVFDAGQVDGTPYLTMELVDGSSLSEVVRQSRRDATRIDVADACRWIADAADGIQHAHDSGVLHRDIKPGNLMLDSEGQVRILDLGLAKFVDDSRSASVAESAGSETENASPINEQLTAAQQILGTPDYMSPEQIMSTATVDGRSDVYSLAATLHFLLTGEVLFGDSGEGLLSKAVAVLQTPAPLISERRSDVPKDLEEAIGRALSKNPDDRPQSAGEFGEILRQFVDASSGEVEQAESASPVTSTDRSSFPPRSRAALWLLAMLPLGAALTGILLYLNGPDGSTLKVQSNDPNIKITAKWDGESDKDAGSLPMKVRVSPGKETELIAGPWVVSVDGVEGATYEISESRFVLSEGEEKQLVVTRINPEENGSALTKPVTKHVTPKNRPSDAELLSRLDALAWKPGKATKLHVGEVAEPAEIDGIKHWQLGSTVPVGGQVIEISPRGTYYLVRSFANKNIYVYQRSSGKLHGMIGVVSRFHVEAEFSPDDTEILVLNEPSRKALVYQPDGVLLRRWADEIDGQTHWSPNGDRILVTKGDAMQMRTPSGERIDSFVAPKHGHDGFLHARIWSPDGSMFACRQGQVIRVYDKDGGAAKLEFDCKGWADQTLCWHPSSRYLLHGSGEGLVARTIDGSKRVIANHHPRTITFSPDGKFLVDDSGLVLSMAGEKVGQVKSPYPQLWKGHVVRWEAEDAITFSALREPGCFCQYTPNGKLIRKVDRPTPLPIVSANWLRDRDQIVSIFPSPYESQFRQKWIFDWNEHGEGTSISFGIGFGHKQGNGTVVGWNAAKNLFSIPSIDGTRTFDATGKQVSHLELEKYCDQATWSPDGKRLAISFRYASEDLVVYTEGNAKRFALKYSGPVGLRWTRDAKHLLVSFSESDRHAVITMEDGSIREFRSRCDQPLSPLGTWTAMATKSGLVFQGDGKSKRNVEFDAGENFDSYQCHWKADESRVAVVVNNWGVRQSVAYEYDFDTDTLAKLDNMAVKRDMIWIDDEIAAVSWNSIAFPASKQSIPIPQRASEAVFARGRESWRGQADGMPLSRDQRFLNVILNSDSTHGLEKGGNLSVIDLQDKRVAWTGIAYSDAERSVIGRSGKVLQSPKEKFDDYLAYSISYPECRGPSMRIVPVSRMQFASRIGLPQQQRVMQTMLDLGGELFVGDELSGDELVSVKAADIADARDLPTVVQCRGVNLSGNPYVTANQISELAALNSIERLSLAGIDLDNWSLSFVAGLDRLRELDLTGASVDNSLGSYLPESLEVLSVYSTNVDDFFLFGLSELESLTRLDVTGTKVTQAAIERLRKQLPACEIVFESESGATGLSESLGPMRQAKMDAMDWAPGAVQKIDGYASTPSLLPGIAEGSWQVMTKYPHTIGDGSASPKGNYVALWCEVNSDPYVRIIERRTGRLAGMVKHLKFRHFGDITWAPDESKFMAWDRLNGRLQASVYSLDGTLIHRWSTKLEGQFFAWSPDLSRILIVGEKRMEQWSPDGRLIDSFVSPSHGFDTASHQLNPFWSPSGERFAGFSGGRIYVYEADGGQPLHVIKANGLDRAGVIWHPSGEKLLTSDGRFWDLSGNHLQFSLDRLHERILAFSPDGRHFVTNHGNVRDLTDNLVSTLDVGQLGYIQGQDIRWAKEDEITFFSFHTRGPGFSVDYSPSGTRLAEYDHPSPVVQHSMSWEPSSDEFVSIAGFDNFQANVRNWVFRWGTQPNQISDGVQLGSQTTTAAAFSPDGSRYVLAQDNGPATVFDSKGKVQYKLDSANSANMCSWSPDGSQLAIGQTIAGSESGVDIFLGKKKICRLNGHSKGVRGLSWSPNGKLLCVWDGNSKVAIWDPKNSDNPVVQKTSHGANFRASYPNDWRNDTSVPSWSPDGSLLAIPTKEVVLLVSPAGADEIALPWTEDQFGTIWWHPNGKRLIAGRVVMDVEKKTKAVIRNAKLPFLFVRWSEGSAFAGVSHHHVGFWSSESAEPKWTTLPRFSQRDHADILLPSRGANSRRVSQSNRYLVHPVGVAWTQHAESGDLCLIDLEQQELSWTGVAFSDGNRVQIEPTGRVLNAPKEIDKYLCYVVTGPDDRVVALSQSEFESRIGLAAERQLLQRLMDLGGVIRTDEGQSFSGLRDAGAIPITEHVTEIQFSRPYDIPAQQLVELAKMPAIRKLDFRGSKINVKSLTFLRDMPSVRQLALASLPVDNSFAAALPPSIEQLDVSGTKIGDFFLMDLKRFKKLKRLNISRTDVSAEAVEKLRKALSECEIITDTD
jgi:serine/threonine protein kinase/uncharacterized protein with WD repeat